MLSMDSDTLVIELQNGSTVRIPRLENAIVEEIFAAHERHLENDAGTPSFTENNPAEKKDLNSLSFGIPFDLGGGAAQLENEMGNFLQHNPELSHSPDFPKEMLTKVAEVSKRLGLDPDTSHLPKAEPHCNCPYCQIARALSESGDEEEAPHALLDDEEPVRDEELTFREWDIVDLGEKMYKVSSPTNSDESFQVFLGEPIGCTCGEKNCEHIRAVLNS